MVAVRTTGLAFDSVIGYENTDGKLLPMVTEAYMRILAQLGNERFTVNKERTERFRSALFNAFKAPQTAQLSSGPCAWEPIEQRRARMREEGLRRKAEAQKAAGTSTSDGNSDSLELGLALE